MRTLIAIFLSVTLQAQTLINHSAGSAASTFTTGAVSMSGANFLVACVSAGNSPVPTLTDSSSNTWTLLTRLTVAGAAFGQIYYAQNPTVTASQTFTLTGTNIFGSLQVAGFSGMLTAAVIDAQSPSGGATATTGTTLAPGTITPAATRLFVTCFHNEAIGVVTVGGSFATTDVKAYVAGTSYGGALAWLSSGSAQNPTWTQPNSSAMVAVMATFKLAAASTTARHRLIMGSLFPLPPFGQ